jgi:hypothetical protein
VLEAIRERAVAEDDGSAEWGIALIFFEMAEWALDGTSAQLCLTKAAQVYLEEIFRGIAVELAASMGRPISLADARQRVPADQRWHGAVAFLETI